MILIPLWLGPMNPAYLIVGAFVLIASWPDGSETCYPATTVHDCMVAAEAYIKGWSGDPTPATAARCDKYENIKDRFPNCRLQTRNCIQGFNCENRNSK